MKYIIKNCPARFNKVNGEQGCTDNLKKLCLDCHEVSDCLLKRIVELCANKYYKDVYELEDKILKLLEIEGVE